MNIKLTSFFFAFLFFAAMGINAQNSAVPRNNQQPLLAGATAPDFTLSDSSGRQITLSKAGMPVVLVFYRGYWCPFCAQQLAELRTMLKPDEKAVMYAISVDPAEKSIDLSKKIAKDGKGEINFSLLSDPGHKTIDVYGLFDPAYIGKGIEGIPHPAVYILDKDRKVVWAKVESDYRKRPTNGEIRDELDKLK